jgi:hypothetical protein
VTDDPILQRAEQALARRREANGRMQLCCTADICPDCGEPLQRVQVTSCCSGCSSRFQLEGYASPYWRRLPPLEVEMRLPPRRYWLITACRAFFGIYD